MRKNERYQIKSRKGAELKQLEPKWRHEKSGYTKLIFAQTKNCTMQIYEQNAWIKGKRQDNKRQEINTEV